MGRRREEVAAPPPVERIVHLVNTPFDARDYGRYGVERLRRRGFRVEVWDTTSALYPGLRQQETGAADGLERVYRFDDKAKLGKRLRSLDAAAFVVTTVPYDRRSFGLYRSLSSGSARYAGFSANSLPPPRRSRRGRANGVRQPRRLLRQAASLPGRIATQVVKRIPGRWLGVRPMDFVLAGGTASVSRAAWRYPVAATTRVIWAHALDYDLYLDELRREPELESDSAVFLDEYVPYHPDYPRSALSPPSIAARYYPAMRTFFDRFERSTGVNVVIAAHPRSDYTADDQRYGGRRVVRDDTVRLVRSARAVLLHASTAANFAVLFRKPVVMLTSEDLEASFVGDSIAAMAPLFGQEPITVDAPPASIEIPEPNEELYAAYREKYIKRRESPEAPFWDIVADRFLEDG